MPVDLPQNYRPSSSEVYMNPLQLEYFRRKLERMREDLVRQARNTSMSSIADSRPEGDQADQASAETEHDMAALNQARARTLLTAVEQALARIANGDYGFCEDTGDPIGLKRLEAEPTATLSVEAKERRERAAGRPPSG